MKRKGSSVRITAESIRLSERTCRSSRRAQGFTLLEMMIGIVILLLCATGVLGLFGFSVAQSSTQGDDATRTAEYAQDKMEQLMALSFSDSTSDLTQFPTASGSCCGLAAGGSVDQGSPVVGYVDYVSSNGTPGATSTGATYIRQWKVENDTNAPPQLKTITVVVRRISAAKGAMRPSTMLISQKCGTTDN